MGNVVKLLCLFKELYHINVESSEFTLNALLVSSIFRLKR